MSTLLVTGGAGYIGSHVVLELLRQGWKVVVVDNFCNSFPESLRRVAKLAGVNPEVVEGDIRDESLLQQIFSDYKIEGVLHFAGLKAVGESVENPLEYFDSNVGGTLVLLSAMKSAGVKRLVFSSSATVYGEPESVPISESHGTGNPSNPYGRTKLHIEQILADLVRADPEWAIAILRYFNPIGADVSGEIGEDPQGVPNNLLPYVAQVAVGQREELQIFGNDYATKDGTCIRDYIHVSDLASGHVCAYRKLEQESGLVTYNLGTGRGYTVLDIVNSFERVTGVRIPYQVVSRREGDLPELWSDPSKAKNELNWVASRNLDEMLIDVWNWQSKNPEGFNDKS
jgi:UDP-glucose 4-epimerase